MGCRCSERRTAIARAAKSLATGNAAAALPHARFVTVSAVEDMMKIMRPRIVPQVKKPVLTPPRPPRRPV